MEVLHDTEIESVKRQSVQKKTNTSETDLISSLYNILSTILQFLCLFISMQGCNDLCLMYNLKGGGWKWLSILNSQTLIDSSYVASAFSFHLFFFLNLFHWMDKKKKIYFQEEIWFSFSFYLVLLFLHFSFSIESVLFKWDKW